MFEVDLYQVFDGLIGDLILEGATREPTKYEAALL